MKILCHIKLETWNSSLELHNKASVCNNSPSPHQQLLLNVSLAALSSSSVWILLRNIVSHCFISQTWTWKWTQRSWGEGVGFSSRTWPDKLFFYPHRTSSSLWHSLSVYFCFCSQSFVFLYSGRHWLLEGSALSPVCTWECWFVVFCWSSSASVSTLCCVFCYFWSSHLH